MPGIVQQATALGIMGLLAGRPEAAEAAAGRQIRLAPLPNGTPAHLAHLTPAAGDFIDYAAADSADTRRQSRSLAQYGREFPPGAYPDAEQQVAFRQREVDGTAARAESDRDRSVVAAEHEHPQELFPGTGRRLRQADSGRGTGTPDTGRGSATPGAGRGDATPGTGRGYGSPGTGRGYASPDSGRGSSNTPAGNIVGDLERIFNGRRLQGSNHAGRFVGRPPRDRA